MLPGREAFHLDALNPGELVVTLAGEPIKPRLVVVPVEAYSFSFLALSLVVHLLSLLQLLGLRNAGAEDVLEGLRIVLVPGVHLAGQHDAGQVGGQVGAVNQLGMHLQGVKPCFRHWTPHGREVVWLLFVPRIRQLLDATSDEGKAWAPCGLWA